MEKIKHRPQNRLKELRQERGWSQAKLAKKIGVSYRTIQNWENGVNQIKEERADELADLFSVPFWYLLGYSENADTPFGEYIPTPREYNSWKEFDYIQLAKTDLDFYVSEELRKNLNPLLLELVLNYTFCGDEERKLLRDVARKFAKGDSVRFQSKD